MSNQPEEYLTTREAGKRLGADDWMVRRVFERGFLPEPPRLGSRRIVRASELPALKKALIAGGYLKE